MDCIINDQMSNEDFKIAFEYACMYGQRIKELLQIKIPDIDLLEKGFQIAIQFNCVSVVELLLQIGNSLSNIIRLSLCKAVEFGYTEVVKIILTRYKEESVGLLSLAVTNGRTDTVEYLLTLPWLNESIETINNAFMWAAQFGDIVVLKLLISRYPDVSKNAAFYQALAFGKMKAVHILEKYVVPNNESQIDTLFSAISNGHEESVCILLEKENIIIDNRHMPIRIAASTKNVAITKMLLDKYSNEQLEELARFLYNHDSNSKSGMENIKFLLCFPNKIDRVDNTIWEEMLEAEKSCIEKGRNTFLEYGLEQSKLVFNHIKPFILDTSTIVGTDDEKMNRFLIEIQK